MAQPSTKKQKTHPTYDLLYHPGIPGRAEFIRLVFEASGVPYNDVARDEQDGYARIRPFWATDKAQSMAGNAPMFAPPALAVHGAGRDGGPLLIAQTPNVLLYLGERTGLVGSREEDKWMVNQVALTALDMNNEVHDTHHPVAVMKYYEEQKPEALLKAQDVRENRLPKYFSYFQRTLQHNRELLANYGGQGSGVFLVGQQLTYADLTVWQVLDGLRFAFPNEMAQREKEYPELLKEFYDSVKEQKGVKEYLASERRQQYGNGVFRHYPELDRQ